jgi:sugar phosphate isomerase/epimerase
VFVCASSRSLHEFELAEACHRLEDLGFSAIELWLDSRGAQVDPAAVAADIDGFVARFRDQTRLVPVALRLTEEVSADVFEGLCKAAKALRVSQLTVPASAKGTPFNEEIDRLGSMVKIARQEGVRVSIKSDFNTLAEDPHTAVELCQAIKGLGVSYDPSYYMRGTNAEQILELVTPHAFHVYLRDSTSAEVQVPVGLGEVDYARILAQLERNRYDRALCADLLPDQSTVEARSLELRKLLMLLESLL